MSEIDPFQFAALLDSGQQPAVQPAIPQPVSSPAPANKAAMSNEQLDAYFREQHEARQRGADRFYVDQVYKAPPISKAMQDMLRDYFGMEPDPLTGMARPVDRRR